MKLLLCLVFVALIATTYAATRGLKLQEYSDACKAESGLSEETLAKNRTDEVNDSKLKDHAFCILKKFGFIDASGEFQVEPIKTKFKEFAKHPEKVDAVVAQCAVKKATPQESSFEFFQCIRNKRPL